MSYYVKMNIIEDVECNNVLPTIAKLKKFISNNAKTIVEKHFDDRPSIYGEWNYGFFKEFVKDDKLKNLNKSWLQNLFGITFIYYPKIKVLAFVSDIDEEFECPYIEFQNACDQDYLPENYCDINFAKEIYEQVFNETQPSKNWLDHLCDTSYDDDDPIDYIKRTFVYSEIEKKLDIKKLMYDIDNFDDEDHYLIDVNMISEIKLIELNKTLNYLIKNEYDNLKI